ncbi:peptidoglycan DD-metalloendopeptidase family protein [Calothrix sp. 336/3]|uniref:peptidoglycan DD-metalloendopeptidase family protein n=1 Tax=Calothrix sp. 336/3 TaxID=1337936 RepID=UPI001EDDCBD6|nr:peptidoglycan DD-metalloendopeptidase family protein [Calothrix sp. 336/3]
MLENTQSEDVPVEQVNLVNPRANRRVPTKAAMIGLALSMGATSLLVTRQSDQALAAEPVGNQNTASTIPAADTEVKFAPSRKLESEATSAVTLPENPVIVEPTAISQVPGLGAKLQVAANGLSVPTSIATLRQQRLANSLNIAVPSTNLTAANNQGETASTAIVSGQTTYLTAQPQTAVTVGTVSNDVNAQLKAQQEFALNRLKQKSYSLKSSLAELRSEETQNPSQVNLGTESLAVAQPKADAEQPEVAAQASRERLISRLKQRNTANTPQIAPSVATPVGSGYEVKPGDTLAAIAQNHGTSVAAIAKANNLSNPNELQISQKLTIPAEAKNNSNSVTVTSVNPTPQAVNNTPVVTPSVATTPEATTKTQAGVVNLPVNPTVPTAATTYGMGGDTPVPTVIAEMQLARRPENRAKNAKSNPRLRVLQAEIERLRAKYRAQQSGTQYEAEENNQSTASVTVTTINENRAAVYIPVPKPMGNNYNSYTSQPVKPSYRVNRPSNEPLNPEFLPGQPAPRWTPPTTRMAAPPSDSDASRSLGSMRGRTVSPQLPPLAAVDRYLPRPIDETNPTISARFIWPAKGVLTSGYGPRWGRMHRGIDIANSTGTPIHATQAGVVERAGWNNGGYGNLVDIRHPDGSLTRYGHNSRVMVQAGQQVQQGQVIAAMGSTGFSTGPHLHFEVHPSGKGAVNPIAFLPPRV